ncbi:hypothetical protein [Streptomyces sp. SID13031]|uniref:hypothetical protein n=1 Tax=Streptomyces sp. SID13031 TaxID=2706046 RepID=UPI0013C8CA57|nr:hypothetical protein [Streptomyces sp. SID13031]NEA34822.1 hypothetical protein [Streptomyces sp. SID13031]
MMKTTLSFHGSRDDISSLLSPWVAELQVKVVGEQFFPNYRADLLKEDLSSTALQSLNRISLQRGTVDLSVSSASSFIDRNSTGLLVALGRQDPRGLRESLLGAMTDDGVAMRMWKKVRNDLHRSLARGAWVVNTVTGTRTRDDGHLYGPGAKQLQNEGVPILGHGEAVRYELD